MRNKKMAAYICIGLLLITTGCGDSDSDMYVSKVDTINFNDEDIEKNSSNIQTNEESTNEVWTVKNSRVNGDSDIDKREGTFSDIKEQLSVNMTGFYEGDDFYAKQVIIYNFV